MKVEVVKAYSHADRERAYRERQGDVGRERDRIRKARSRASRIPEFIGVDSEGIGRGKNHRTVLLGVGAEHYVARSLSDGLHWKEVFEFLYQQYEKHPKAAFVGFYLSYDFNNWLSSLPVKAAVMLLTEAGKHLRAPKPETGGRKKFFPVRVDGWEVDILGFKRLSIRPIAVGCVCGKPLIKCTVKHNGWMHICDAGPFFQMSFLRVIDAGMWSQDPDGPICSPEEYEKVKEGKNYRPFADVVDEKMIYYNYLENLILSRVLGRLAKGFLAIGIRLGKDQWYGPGATAQRWLRNVGALKHDDIPLDDWFLDLCRSSYYGGWFEIFSHGLILGSSWNYDLNNAYPFATSKLPHICERCTTRRGNGTYQSNGNYVLLYGTMRAKGTRIGPVPYRAKDGGILRPRVAKGWYWKHEIDAANAAGLLGTIRVEQWAEFIPCTHEGLFGSIQELYDLRLEKGKYSALGMAIKLNNNSAYGKFAQSVGAAPYNNWLYASLITSYCRTQILDAIASHPDKANAVLMVATDGVCFDSRHPELPISKRLGEWEETRYENLCLFKPGFYWHREGKERLAKIKSRGVPKTALAEGIEQVEWQFRTMLEKRVAPGDLKMWAMLDQKYGETPEIAPYIVGEYGWPKFAAPVSFRLKSARQALNEGKWNEAGTVQEEVFLMQDSWPGNKRWDTIYNFTRKRLDSHLRILPKEEVETTYYHKGLEPATVDIGYGFDGPAESGIIEAAVELRGAPAQYNLPVDMEWVNVHGGSK